LGTAAAKFDAVLASLALLQQQQQQSRGEVDHGVERVCSIKSLGRPYTLRLPNDSSNANVNADSLQKDLTNSNPNSLSGSKDTDSVVRQLKTLESGVH